MGKSKKKPHKPKSEDTNQEKLYMLHMDLCGPMRVASVNGKKYILVIIDDYSRFTWVKCLRSKDEAPDFIIKFLKMIQVRLKLPVRRIITDNETEFVNQILREYYEKVGISHETSVARSPQQNGVVERQNLASEYSSSGPALHEMTPATISLGLVPNPSPSTSHVPPSRTDWDILFQLMFNELLTHPPSVDLPAPEVIAPVDEVVAPVPAVSTGSPSSTNVDQDAPSPIAHMGNDPYFGVPILKVPSDQSSSSESIHTLVEFIRISLIGFHSCIAGSRTEQSQRETTVRVYQIVYFFYVLRNLTVNYQELDSVAQPKKTQEGFPSSLWYTKSIHSVVLAII
ncbi:retrovirus-related pol polyprotein from transposon TNT 1-94 [Tanacetum coccineum]